MRLRKKDQNVLFILDGHKNERKVLNVQTLSLHRLFEIRQSIYAAPCLRKRKVLPGRRHVGKITKVGIA